MYFLASSCAPPVSSLVCSGFAVLIDGAGAVAAEVVDLPQIDVRPDFDPFVARVQIAVERVAECVRRRRIILLIEKGFAHAEVGERVVLLQVERLGVLLDGVVEAALFGQGFAARDDGTHVQRGRSTSGCSRAGRA